MSLQRGGQLITAALRFISGFNATRERRTYVSIGSQKNNAEVKKWNLAEMRRSEERASVSAIR